MYCSTVTPVGQDGNTNILSGVGADFRIKKKQTTGTQMETDANDTQANHPLLFELVSLLLELS